jgi:O-antigen ligase
MGAEVEKTLQLRRRAGKAARPVPTVPEKGQPAQPRPKLEARAFLAMGLWFLLWLGYNTDITRALNPYFPTDTTDLIHGVRAFFPMLAGWIALILIFLRSSRALHWIMGPLGLILLYTVTGLVSSVTISTEPTYALYYGFNYLAVVLILLALLLVKDPLPDLLKVLKLTWTVSMILTISLLVSIPFIGASALSDTDAGPVGLKTYNGAGTVMGMASTRNTGFARYAAVSALAVLPGMLRKGNLFVRIILGIVFGASVYAEVLANGRTEILAFICAAAVILGAEKARRVVNFMAAIAALVLLGIRGFFSGFFLYFTRTGHIDTTLTGRTETWGKAWRLLWESPWVGYGFQGDRYFLKGQHMHDAFLHVLFQSGFLGGMAIIIALGVTWYYIIYYYVQHPPSDKSLIPPEIPAIFLFTTISSITESTFAYYSAAWLLTAPIVPYMMALHRRTQVASLQAAQERALRIRTARRTARVSESPVEAPPTAPGGAIPA